MKTKMKRITAALCTITMLATTFLAIMPARQAKAAETVPASLKQITFSDFGIADGTYKADAGKFGTVGINQYSGESLENTLFTAKVNFSTTGSTFLMLGGTKSWAGIALQVYREASGRDIIKLYDGKASTDTKMFSDKLYDSQTAGRAFTGVDVDLKLSIQYVADDGDEMPSE